MKTTDKVTGEHCLCVPGSFLCLKAEALWAAIGSAYRFGDGKKEDALTRQYNEHVAEVVAALTQSVKA